jgi:hypothetical protein
MRMTAEAQQQALREVEFTMTSEAVDHQRQIESVGTALVAGTAGLVEPPARASSRWRQLIERVSALGARALRGVGYIVRMVSDDELSRSYWPEAERKSKPRVLAGLLWWLIRHGEVNHFYYLYGLDRKDVRRNDVMPYRAFRRRRDQLNMRVAGVPYSYVCVLRDKFLFAQLLTSVGIPTPKTLALLDRTTVTWLDRKQKVPLARIAESAHGTLDGFCKRIDGTQGQGAFPLKIENGRISSNGVELSPSAFCKLIDGRFLFQERIEQHPEMSALHPASVNTIRLITYFRHGKPVVFCGSARMGTAGRTVDNWSAGGLSIRVDIGTGTLHREAFYRPGAGGRITRHPDTHIVFEGFRIPHFHDAVKLVLQLHEYLPQIHSIGWDIAISKHGPVIIEGNDDWHGIVPMLHERDVKRRLLAMFQRH